MGKNKPDPYILCWQWDKRLCPMGYSKDWQYVNECYKTHKKNGYKIYKLVEVEDERKLRESSPPISSFRGGEVIKKSKN